MWRTYHRTNRPLHVAGQQPGANVNTLTDPTDRDALSGNAALNGIEVTVTPRSYG